MKTQLKNKDSDAEVLIHGQIDFIWTPMRVSTSKKCK